MICNRAQLALPSHRNCSILQQNHLSLPSVTVANGRAALRRRCGPCLAAGEEPGTTGTKQDVVEPSTSSSTPDVPSSDRQPKKKTQAESTDAISTFLTRRFGLAGGLAWLGFLAVGSLGEQVKTRMEVAKEEAGVRDVALTDQTEVTLPGGVRVRDVRVGGGQSPAKGLLMVVDYVGKADGVVFEDTKARGKPIVFFLGGRPYTGGLCAGVDQALAGMKAGGRRIITVPPELGFGDRGAMLRPTEHVPEKQGIIPAGATLEYDLELLRVSIPPS